MIFLYVYTVYTVYNAANHSKSGNNNTVYLQYSIFKILGLSTFSFLNCKLLFFCYIFSLFILLIVTDSSLQCWHTERKDIVQRTKNLDQKLKSKHNLTQRNCLSLLHGQGQEMWLHSANPVHWWKTQNPRMLWR